jgi:hypothetical protein
MIATTAKNRGIMIGIGIAIVTMLAMTAIVTMIMIGMAGLRAGAMEEKKAGRKAIAISPPALLRKIRIAANPAMNTGLRS